MARREERVLREAAFEDAARYFVWSTAIVLVASVVMIPLMPIVLPLVWWFKRLEYRHIRMYLTERTLVVHKGVFNKSESTVPLEKVTDLAVKQGPIMKWCGVEAISVETAGQSMGGALVQLVGVQDARGFRDAVLEQKDRLTESGGHDSGDGSASGRTRARASEGEAALLAEILETLRRIEGKLGDGGSGSGGA